MSTTTKNNSTNGRRAARAFGFMITLIGTVMAFASLATGWTGLVTWMSALFVLVGLIILKKTSSTNKQNKMTTMTK